MLVEARRACCLQPTGSGYQTGMAFGRLLMVSASVALVLACGAGEGDEGAGSMTASDPSCTSGTRWAGGNEESSQMHPGGECIACHQQQGEGPTFTVAGTVFATTDEKLDCFGEPGVAVELVANDGQTITLDTNSAGNFEYRGALAFPLQARVVRGAVSNAMASPVTNGDCNHCHTETGQEGAPGRILAP